MARSRILKGAKRQCTIRSTTCVMEELFLKVKDVVTMLDKVNELIYGENRRHVNFGYSKLYGKLTVECTIGTFRNSGYIFVTQFANTEEEALEKTIELFNQAIKIDEIEHVTFSEKDKEYLYCSRKFNDNTEVIFENRGDLRFFITRINKDKDISYA